METLRVILVILFSITMILFTTLLILGKLEEGNFSRYSHSCELFGRLTLISACCLAALFVFALCGRLFIF